MSKEVRQFIEVPYCIQLQNNKIIHRKAYEEFNIKRKVKLHNKEAKLNLKDGKSSGVMNRFIKAKMKRIIRNFIEILKVSPYDASGYKKNMPTFITLTLSSKQVHTDKEIYRLLLNEFVITIKRRFNVSNYIWRAERQKNGNIHYHILADKYINYKEVREIWNVIQAKNGYIKSFVDKQKRELLAGFSIVTCAAQASKDLNVKKSFIDVYLKQKDSPNSTDIHGLQSVVDVESYICKYMSKCDLQEELALMKLNLEYEKVENKELAMKIMEVEKEIKGGKIDGRIWGCSDEIKNLKDPVYICDNVTDQLITELKSDKKVRIKEHENMVIYYLKDIMIYVNNYRQISNYISRLRRKEYFDLYLKNDENFNIKVKDNDKIPVPKVTTKYRITSRQMDLFYRES